MGYQDKRMWLNLDTGLFTESLFEDNKMVSCKGKKVPYDMIELDHVAMNDRFYEILRHVRGTELNLVELAEVDDVESDVLKRVVRVISSLDGGEELFDPEASCSGFLYKTMGESEDKVRDIRSFLTWFCTDACQGCDTCDMYTKLKAEFKEEIK